MQSTPEEDQGHEDEATQLEGAIPEVIEAKPPRYSTAPVAPSSEELPSETVIVRVGGRPDRRVTQLGPVEHHRK